MRPAKPWYPKDRDAWYVQHNGKQVLLARGKESKAEASIAFHKLMLTEGQPASAVDMPMATLCDLFLDFSQANHTAEGYGTYQPASLLHPLRSPSGPRYHALPR